MTMVIPKALVRLLYCMASISILTNVQGQPILPLERISISHHQGVIQGHAIEFNAEVKETIFWSDDNKSPTVSAITTSYIIENNGTPDSVRPILFVFNGGPGASSSPLHMNAFGPMRILQSRDSPSLIPNSYSLLDLADLVFIDPPGTGFTKVFDSIVAAMYWDVKGDAKLFVDLINKWKKDHHRESSPIFLCGESYGTTRAAMILGIAKDLPISGVIFLSSLFDMSIVNPAPANDMPYVLFLPSMAALAWYHHKLSPGIKSATQAYNEAIQFSLNEYISALAKGINLPIKERQHTIFRLSQIIGLPSKTLMEKDIRITPLDFELLLLETEKKRIGQLNGQITGPLHNPGVKPPFDDPSMSMRPSTKGIVGNYFNQYLKFSDTLSYKTLNLDINSRWNWSSMQEEIGYSTVIPKLQKAIKEQPGLKLFVTGGYYDLATPLYAARYELEHSGIPKEKITYVNFPTGHSIFENEIELEKLTKLIRRFINSF